MEEKDKILGVELLGKFRVTYGGEEVLLGRNSTSKFIQLFQLVWLRGEKGIAKEELLEYLYGEDDVTDPGNSFNNLIFQARRQLGRLKIPGRGIGRVKGVYVPDTSVPLWVDTVEFERLYKQAEQADGAEKYRLYSRALDLYKGELLSDASGEAWVMLESVRFQRMFEDIVLWLGGYLKEKKEYDKMYALYSKAAELYPYDDWQIYQIDSLLSRGESREAYGLYEKTVRRYSEEMGLPPSDKMLECYKRMSERLAYCPGDLSTIRKEMAESSLPDQKQEGAYYCSYPGFVDTYRVLSRSMERIGTSIFLMLCTLVDYEGKMIKNQEKLKKRSDILKEAIGRSLRRGDTYTKYNSSQYLLLLIGTRQEDCRLIFRRLSRNLKEEAGERAEIRYSVTTLAELPEEGMEL